MIVTLEAQFTIYSPMGRRDVTRIARRYDSEAARRRILSTCVRLFIEKGYREATMAEIIREADVSASTFQNIFRNKSGVLFSLTEFMFQNQFGLAHSIVGDDPSPALLYAVETSLQIALADISEHLREVYLEAYTCPETVEYINRNLSAQMFKMFQEIDLEASPQAYYELSIGTAGIMRSYMSVSSSPLFSLEQKVFRFLQMSLRAWNIPQQEAARCIEFVQALDIRTLATQALDRLIHALAVRYDFTLTRPVSAC